MSRMLQHVCLFGDVSSIPSQMVDPPWTLPNRDLQYFSLAQKCQRSHSVPGSPQPPTAPFADMLMVCLLAALPERYLLRRLTHNGGEIDTPYPIPQNFERLVLGCIDASDSESRRIFQYFSNPARFARFSLFPALVIGCIDASDNENRPISTSIFQHFSRLT